MQQLPKPLALEAGDQWAYQTLSTQVELPQRNWFQRAVLRRKPQLRNMTLSFWVKGTCYLDNMTLQEG